MQTRPVTSVTTDLGSIFDTPATLISVLYPPWHENEQMGQYITSTSISVRLGQEFGLPGSSSDCWNKIPTSFTHSEPQPWHDIVVCKYKIRGLKETKSPSCCVQFGLTAYQHKICEAQHNIPSSARNTRYHSKGLIFTKGTGSVMALPLIWSSSPALSPWSEISSGGGAGSSIVPIVIFNDSGDAPKSPTSSSA